MKTFETLLSELQEIQSTRPDGLDFLKLAQEIQSIRPGDSNTAALLDAGVHAIGKKIVEEAAEVWMAAEHETDEELALEISQLMYHLGVMMVARGISLQDVEARL